MRGPVQREDGFRVLFDEHYDAVLRYCLRRSDPQDAPDVAAQVFAVAWRKLDAAPEPAYIRPWLFRIARYELSTSHRTRRRVAALRAKLNGLAPPQDGGPEGIIVQSAEQARVLSALDALSVSDREVVMLRCYEEMNTRQIAVALQCSEDAAKKRLSRALQRLRKTLGVRSAGTSPPPRDGGDT